MENVTNLLLQLGALAGGGAGLAALLSYMRNRRKDSMDAYSDLLGKLESRCEALEAKCETLDEQIRKERNAHASEIGKLRKALGERDLRIEALERQLKQVGLSGAYLIDKLREE